MRPTLSPSAANSITSAAHVQRRGMPCAPDAEQRPVVACAGKGVADGDKSCRIPPLVCAQPHQAFEIDHRYIALMPATVTLQPRIGSATGPVRGTDDLSDGCIGQQQTPSRIGISMQRTFSSR